MLASELNSFGIQVHLVVWAMPKPWRKENHWYHDGIDTVGRRAIPEHIDDYARYVTAAVLHARELGFHVSFVEPGNEPDLTGNTRWEPCVYAQMVVHVRASLDANGLSGVGIEGPGTGTLRAAPPFLEALERCGGAGSLAAVSVHDWDTRHTPDTAGLGEEFPIEMKALGRALPLFITEYNDENPRWGEPPYQAAPVQRLPGPVLEATDTRDFAVAVSAEALQLFTDGAEWISYWQQQDLPWGYDSMGLIDLQGRIRPSADAFQSWLSLIPRGASTAAIEEADPRFAAAAFRSGRNVTLVVANISAAPLSLHPHVTGLGPGTGRIISHNAFLARNEVAANTTYAEISRNGSLVLRVPGSAIVTVGLEFP